MPAFQRAIELGYTYLETDVQISADGVLVAFHDDDLQRTCGRPGRISQLPWREIATARVDGREPIPRLDELLSAWPTARFNIDCKADAAAMPLADLLDDIQALERVCVASFSDRRLVRLRRRLGPTACTALGPADIAGLRLLGRRPRTGLAAQVPVSTALGRGRRFPIVTPRFLSWAHRSGIQVHVWTVDDADEMRRLLDLGVDGLMSGRPALLRDVLVERGAWH